jgi:hypothetical protein
MIAAVRRSRISSMRKDFGVSMKRLIRWVTFLIAVSTTITAAEAATSPDQGPGGPILVVSSSANPFTKYYAEILRAEGFNAFAVADISTVSPSTLAAYDVVILGEMALTSSQVTMFSDYVTSGGNLIAMRPDKQLSGLLGLTFSGSTLSDAYLLVDTSGGPGIGIVNQTIQFHGPADLYTLSGGWSLATLYSNSTTATQNPAVTWRSIGPSGGQAAAFTFDLARSIVYTRQGNPVWSGQERDGVTPIRSDDLFFGAAVSNPQPDWINLSKVQIPQADEQQRFLANLILLMNLDRKPLPRFWYFPNGKKAVVVMTSDSHQSDGIIGRFDHYKSLSPAGCSVANWECIRASAYISSATVLTNTQAAGYIADGFDIGWHINTGCNDWTSQSQLDTSFYTPQLNAFQANFPSVPPPTTNRTHCLAWSDYSSQPQVELNHGIRLDATYYYWPGSWIKNQPGLFTGSGMPMRFATSNGTMIDVYQATTQMTDESGQSYPFNIDTLLNNALGPTGYYGAFTANMHSDGSGGSSCCSDDIVASAQAHNVSIISAKQMLTWLDGRNGSSFNSLLWNGSTLSFTIGIGTGANGLQAMLPTTSNSGPLSSITLNGTSVSYTKQTIKGIEYAVFSASAGAYQVNYSTVSTGGPVITSLSPTSGPVGTSVTISGSNFGSTQGTSTVAFNGNTASITSWGATSIVALVPGGASTGNVVVSVGGVASNGSAFAVTTTAIPHTNWTLKFVDSQETTAGNYAATNAFDGNPNTMWHTAWTVSPVPPQPHEIQINLGAVYNVSGILETPRQDGQTIGMIAQFAAYVSMDGVNWGTAVATGTWAKDATQKQALFTPKSGQYVRLQSLSEVSGLPYTSMAELNVLGSLSAAPPPPSITSLSPTSGAAGTSVTISGSNFGSTQGTSTVAFNGNTASITSWGATSIVALVPGGASTGNVVVSVGGVASNGVAFTVTTGAPTLTLAYNGMLRDRVGQCELCLNPDGVLDGVFTVTLNAGSGNRTVTQLQLTNSAGGVWDTIAPNGFWSLGAATGLDSQLLNNPANDSVNFAVTAGSSFNLFAADYQNRMYVNGTVFTLAATFADGSKVMVNTTISSTTTYSDSFNRANSSTLGANWLLEIATSTNCQIASNAVAAGSTAKNCEDSYNATFPNDQWSQFTITTINNNAKFNLAWVDLRVTGTNQGNGYRCGAWSNGSGGSTSFIQRITNGGGTTIQTSSTGFASGDILYCSAVGNTITLKKNGATVTSVTDSTWTSGHGGLGIYAQSSLNDVVLNAWSGGGF